MTECQRQSAKVEESKKNNAGLLGDAEQPACMEDGSFNPIQCSGSTGYCWCVNTETGDVLLGTKIRGASPNCESK